MQTRFLSSNKLIVIGCAVIAVMWLAVGGSIKNDTVARDSSGSVWSSPQGNYAADKPNNGVKLLPEAVGTVQMVLPGETSKPTAAPETPTPAPLQAATLITPNLISNLVTSSALGLTQKAAADAPDPIVSMSWAKTGDKLVYATKSGSLYWSNPDGTNATLLRTYTIADGEGMWDPFEGQVPMSNTLFALHIGEWNGQVRLPSHMDIVRFRSGLAPTIEESSDMPVLTQIHWWNSDRASGRTSKGDIGGDMLVTVDANGHKISEQNVPYMQSGAVQPGGVWLAYATSQQTTSTPLYGSTPETVYLLNLNTGQRLQITSSGSGNQVFNWSPDGNWFLMSSIVNHAVQGVLVSADGSQQILVGPPGSDAADAVWSPDSKRLAFTVQGGGRSDPNEPGTDYTSQAYIVDVPARKLDVVDKPTSAPDAGMMMHPSWSPDGSFLTFISFKPVPLPLVTPEACPATGCPGSGLSPAFYLMSPPAYTGSK